MESDKHVPSFLEVAQQDLQTTLPGELVNDEELHYMMDRSCTPHCVEAIAEMLELHIPAFERLDEYIGFLRSNGPHIELGSSNQEFYSVDDGWYNMAIADLLRINGFSVVSQNMNYSGDSTDEEKAKVSGRIRSTQELAALQRLKGYGGEKNPNWVGALNDTLQNGGFPIVSIAVPSSKIEHAVGRHSIVVTGVDDQNIYYFDPDKLAVERYKENAGTQEIRRTEDNRLIYSQTSALFLERMTGEVIHIFPPSSLQEELPAAV